MSERDTKRLARTLARVSSLRGIPSTRPVPGVKLARDRLVARVKEKAIREYPAEALRREGQVLQLLGFAPAGFDYLGAMMTLLEQQLDGFYDPKNRTMYLAGDLEGDEARATLAHELVHALQDQRWDLESRSGYQPGRSDQSLARAALAEGDATSLMIDFLAMPEKSALGLDDTMLKALIQSTASMANVQNVPHILRTTLVAPYGEGIAFVHALRRRGGWPAVDAAWARLPTTTEQILHVDKWQAGEVALDVPAPSGAALGAGWTRSDEDSNGELGFLLAFGEWMGAEDAREAAAGWGGDRTATYVNGGEIAHAIHLRYDAQSQADRGFAKLDRGLRVIAPDVAGEKDTYCVERPEIGPLLVAKRGRDLVFTMGPARTQPWTSASTCARAKAWAAEIAKQ